MIHARCTFAKSMLFFSVEVDVHIRTVFTLRLVANVVNTLLSQEMKALSSLLCGN